MPAVWWLAVLGQPVFLLPLPQAADTPAVLAIARGEAGLRPPCLSLRCLRTGWESPRDGDAGTDADRSPFAAPHGLPPTASPGLHAPVSRRAWTVSEGHDWRVGARYGFVPIRGADTTLTVELGGGYRFQPRVDDGTSTPGPVARGRVELTRQLGAWMSFSQRLQLESGRDDTYLRNVFALDVRLDPRWRLRSQVQLVRDSDGTDSATTGSVQLRYLF